MRSITQKGIEMNPLLYGAYVLSLSAFLNNVTPLGLVMNEVVRKDLINPVMDEITRKLDEN